MSAATNSGEKHGAEAAGGKQRIAMATPPAAAAATSSGPAGSPAGEVPQGEWGMHDRAKRTSASGKSLENESILRQLEALTEKMGITLRRESVASGAGGLCRVKGTYVLIVDSHASLAEQIRVIAESLQRFDLGGVSMKPGLRQLLAGSEE